MRDLGIGATVALAVVGAVGSVLHVAIGEKEEGKEGGREGGRKEGREGGGVSVPLFSCRVLV